MNGDTLVAGIMWPVVVRQLISPTDVYETWELGVVAAVALLLAVGAEIVLRRAEGESPEQDPWRWSGAHAGALGLVSVLCFIFRGWPLSSSVGTALLICSVALIGLRLTRLWVARGHR